MSAAGQKPDPDDYLDYFGLFIDPFEITQRPLFEGDRRRELINELLSQCRFSSRVLAVLGESGVGKSCFREALCLRLESKARICVVDVPLLSGAEQILSHIAQQLGVPEPTAQHSPALRWDAQAWGLAIGDFVEQTAQGSPVNLVVVENAHGLDDDSLDRLLDLTKSTQGVLHLALFGEPDLGKRLTCLEGEGSPLQTFSVDALSPSDLEDYLRFRLEAAGFAGIFPFKPEDIRYLWEVSQGVPAAVHNPARDLLIDLALPPPEPESFGLPIGHMVAITTLVAGLLIAVFYRSGEQAEAPVPNPVGVDARLGSPTASPPDQVRVTGGGETEAESKAPPLTARASSRTPVSGEVDDLEQAPKEDATSFSSLADQQLEPEPGGESLATERSAASAEPLKAAVGASAGDPESRPQPFFEAEKDLLARSPQRFALQISAAASKDSVEEFIRRQSNRDELAAFTTRRNGKILHIIVAGDFATAEEARSAVSRLPEKQQQSGPWPRSLRSVQAEIRQAREF